jgi:hypothetical protein
MPRIDTLWIGMKTAVGDSDAGTDSSLVLIINDGSEPVDTVHFTLPETAQDNPAEGTANLYQVDLNDEAPHEGRTFDPQKLNDSSVRVAIRGDNAWLPGSCFVWGRQTDRIIVPLALNVVDQGFKQGELPTMRISTDAREGRTSFGVTRVQPGDNFTGIARLILLLTTADQDNAGTDDPITLTITDTLGRVVVDQTFTDTSQPDLEQAQANFYYAEVDVPFLKFNLNNESIQLTIRGDDAWIPASLFLFGLDAREGETVKRVTPLVHLPRWPLGVLSTDPSEGAASVFLPLANTTGPIILQTGERHGKL